MFVLYWAKISGERLQDHWSSGPIIVCSNNVYIVDPMPKPRRRRGGLVVERWTPGREVGGSTLTWVTVLYP